MADTIHSVRKHEVVLQNSSPEMIIKVSVTTKTLEFGEKIKEFVLLPNLICALELDYGTILDTTSYCPGKGVSHILASHHITTDEKIEFFGRENDPRRYSIVENSTEDDDFPNCYVVLENNTGDAVLVRAEGSEQQVKIEPWDAEGTSLPIGTIITATKFDGSPIQPSSKMILGHEVINFV